jgi:hypothetical protein
MAAPGDEHWDPQIGQPGITEWVYALAVHGNSIYASGVWSTNVHIWVWNGTNWSTIGIAENAPYVSDFAFLGNDVYASGFFSQINGVPAVGLARWDGTNWHAVSGFSGAVYATAGDGTQLYVGGSFTAASEVPSRFLARWDGVNWFSLGSGPNSNVTAIAVSGSEVYVGGLFTKAGGVTANRIAKWNGSAWSSLGTGSSNGVGGSIFSIFALAVNGPDVYVGGSFTIAGGRPVNRIAKWNGADWSALGTGISGPDAQIQALAFSGGKLYAGGSFTNAGGIRVSSIASWDGTNWMSLGGGVEGGIGGPKVFALAARGADLYVGGTFERIGQQLASHIAHWNEQRNFVLPSMMRLSNPQQSTSGRFQFRVTSSGAAAYVIEATTNFGSWTPLLTNSVSPFDFEDAGPFSESRFYRTRQQ